MDKLDAKTRSELMRHVKSEGTKPEMLVAQMLRSLRFKFELNARNLVGKPDFVLRRRKKAIFVHGCFWHLHHCRRGRLPTSNLEFWSDKLGKSRSRDARTRKSLRDAGWAVLTIWECQLFDVPKIKLKVAEFLRNT